ncbi:MAG: family 20 glycosylhydrolase [Chitinophagaceae bacterium]
MRRKCCYCVLALLLMLSSHAQQSSGLYPQPAKISYAEGKLPLQQLQVNIPTTAGKDIAFALKTLQQAIKESTGQSAKTANAGTVAVQYSVKKTGYLLPGALQDKTPEQQTREYYKLEITAAKVIIDANTSTGLYYAVQTIRQLIKGNGKNAYLPLVSIEDKPTLPYRGVMMDFAHGGQPTVEEIKKQIDFLALWKTNQYYFYTENNIMLDGYPTMNYGAQYTKQDIKEIIAYGLERHIDVIPFVAFYGHQHNLLHNEKYASLAIGKYGHELDPRNPGVDELLKNWIKQITELFPSPFIHVGFDETWETNRMSQDQDSSIHSEALWLQQLNFVQQELKKYGRTVMAWTDMSNYYPDIMKKFPTEVIPVIWEYRPDTAYINHFLNPVLAEKRSFFIQPAVSGWGHIYPSAVYTYDNIDLCLKAGIANHTLGFIHSVWTDAVEPFIRPSWMYMAYGCIAAWQGTVPDKKTFSSTYSSIVYPAAANHMQDAFAAIDSSMKYLEKCLGKNTQGMPRGTITESWLNPFSAYYLANTNEHLNDFKLSRQWSETAEASLLNALAEGNKKDSSFINSLLVSARLINYSAARFIWAKTITDRFNDAIIGKKKNDFVIYDIAYPCHGLIIDMLDEVGNLKTDYAAAWLTENKPYRLNTITGRFDTEFALWQKLLLKVMDYRVQHPVDYVPAQTFEEIFHPGY